MAISYTTPLGVTEPTGMFCGTFFRLLVNDPGYPFEIARVRTETFLRGSCREP